MNDIKSIRINGEVNITFGDDSTKEIHMPSAKELIEHVLEDVANTDTDREKICNMTVGEFLSLYEIHWNARKMSILEHPERYTCLACNMGNLYIVDGHLKCSVCGKDYGDIDELPDMM